MIWKLEIIWQIRAMSKVKIATAWKTAPHDEKLGKTPGKSDEKNDWVKLGCIASTSCRRLSARSDPIMIDGLKFSRDELF